MSIDDYLDPDRHLWPECPDDRCYLCGEKFPADLEIEEDTPQWEGFCSKLCRTRFAFNQQRQGTYKIAGEGE